MAQQFMSSWKWEQGEAYRRQSFAAAGRFQNSNKAFLSRLSNKGAVLIQITLHFVQVKWQSVVLPSLLLRTKCRRCVLNTVMYFGLNRCHML